MEMLGLDVVGADWGGIIDTTSSAAKGLVTSLTKKDKAPEDLYSPMPPPKKGTKADAKGKKGTALKEDGVLSKKVLGVTLWQGLVGIAVVGGGVWWWRRGK